MNNLPIIIKYKEIKCYNNHYYLIEIKFIIKRIHRISLLKYKNVPLI